MRVDDFSVACVNYSPAKATDRACAGRMHDGTSITLRIGRALGEGGMGVVYDAHAADGRVFAMKVLRAELGRDVGAVRRFEREIAHGRYLDHPHVVTARGDGHLDDGRPFLLMDRLEGTTLGALVRDEGPLSVGRALRLGVEILSGLDAIHRAGLVHRDLSPDNVFVSRGAWGERASILDLGFAQQPGVDAGDGVNADSRGSLVGTLAFMAPEQATRSRAITAQSDLFAAGLLVYFALSGLVPFRGRDAHDVLVSVVRSAPTPIRHVRRDAPAVLDHVFTRALAKHPDARFGGAREMRDALVAMAVADAA